MSHASSKAKSLALSAALAFALTAAFGSSFAQEEPQFLKHESPEAGYALDLPLDWDIKTSLKDWDCAAFAPKSPASTNGYLESVSVALLDGKELKSPLAAAGAMTAALKARSQDFSLISQQELKVSGCDAARISYSYESGSVKAMASTLFVAKGERLWALTFSGEPRRFIAKKALFDKVEASFRPL